MSLVIGLTGSIATGKSTISSMFTELGIPVIDADKLARDVVEPGEAAYLKLIEEFGESILLNDQSIDRERLGAIVFSNEDKRKKLNGIVHPAIRKRMVQQREELIALGEACIVLDIPLLFESKLEHFVDKTLVVYVDEAIQLSRLMERNKFSKEEAQARIHAQIPVKKKAEKADGTINNNGTIDESFNQLKEILSTWDCAIDE